MGYFAGYVTLASAMKFAVPVKNSSDVPVDADSTPTYRIYGPSGGVMTSGTGSLSVMDSGDITDATNASPIVITSANHKLTTGTKVTIAGVVGNNAANGTFDITVVDQDTFSLDGSTGDGAYTSDGAWHVTGLYLFSYTPTAGNGFAAGSLYTVLVQAVVSSNNTVDTYTFIVV